MHKHHCVGPINVYITILVGDYTHLMCCMNAIVWLWGNL